MLKSVPLFIALRYLRAKRLNRFASIVSSVSVAGIGLGVGVLLIVLSVMNGFEREVAARILGMTADITLFGSPDRMQDWRSLAARVRQHPEVRAAEAFVRGSGMLNARGKVQGVVLYGVPRDGEAEVSRLTEYLEGITLDALTNDGKPPAVILGRTLADRLSLASGDQVTLISPSWDNAQQLSLPAYDRLEVAGTFKAGMHEFDSTFGVMALEDAARLFQLGEGVSGLRIRLQDSARAPAVAAALGAELGEGYFVVDWTRFHRNFFLALESQKRIMFVVLSLIVAVAAFNVVASDRKSVV